MVICSLVGEEKLPKLLRFDMEENVKIMCKSLQERSENDSLQRF